MQNQIVMSEARHLAIDEVWEHTCLWACIRYHVWHNLIILCPCKQHTPRRQELGVSLRKLVPVWSQRCERFKAVHPYFPGEGECVLDLKESQVLSLPMAF